MYVQHIKLHAFGQGQFSWVDPHRRRIQLPPDGEPSYICIDLSKLEFYNCLRTGLVGSY